MNKKVEEKEDLARESIQSKSSAYAKKMAVGGMGGMGMPLIMPGMKFTKPS